MNEYHKIDTVFKRDLDSPKSLLFGHWTNETFEYLAKNEWTFTEKVDGTNIRILINERAGTITFGGRTDNAQLPAPLVKRLEDRFLPQKDKLFTLFPGEACLYGEGYGAGIQKGGGNYRQDQDFVLFDIRVGNWWLRRQDVELDAGLLDLAVVPIIGRGTLLDMVSSVEVGMTSRWGNFTAEGIVARPSTELNDRGGKRIITKIKHRDFPW